MKAASKIILAALVAALTGCAAPASQIKVPTQSMEDAWKATPMQVDRASDAQAGRLVGAVLRQEQPLPVVSAPDIRMAFFYPAQDAEGNMHYGSWVAIPVDTFKWLMPEGARLPMGPAMNQQPLRPQ